MAKPKFSNSWFKPNIPAWEYLFDSEFDPKEELLGIEIGVFEGQSTCWLADNILLNPNSKLICIDSFEGSAEHGNEDLSSLQETFERNIATTGKKNQIEIIKSYSYEALLDLNIKKVQADFIYIDGSHEAPDVLADAILAYHILKPGGIIIFDDYLWRLVSPDNPLRAPKIAIDSFITMFYAKVKPVMANTLQMYVKKIA